MQGYSYATFQQLNVLDALANTGRSIGPSHL